MPKPTQPATTLEVHTPRRRIMCMSIIGTGTRSSTATHAAASTTATANRPRIRADVQPHWLPSLSAISSATSHPASRRAGPTGRRAGVRTGDSGTNSSAAAAATRVTTIGSQNSPL